MSVTIKTVPAISTVIAKSRQPQAVFPAYMMGGFIENPATTDLQNTSVLEPLLVDPTGPASQFANGTTILLQPGQRFRIIPNSTSAVWVAAQTAGHTFSAYGETVSNDNTAKPIPMNFPPDGPVTMTQAIGSYLYKEYDDDDDLQSFVDSYNEVAQTFINTINGMNLPIYTQPQISGALLDWVAQGLYGMVRPALASGQNKTLGPLNTYAFNSFPTLNSIKRIGPNNVVVTTDDTFKRILTWAFLKGDGKVFNVRWLKRRIMRFLTGVNGTAPNVNNTYQISITFGINNEVAIRFIDYISTFSKGALFNGFALNTARFNEIDLAITPLTPLPYRDIFLEAVQTGALELPFQFTYDIIL